MTNIRDFFVKNKSDWIEFKLFIDFKYNFQISDLIHLSTEMIFISIRDAFKVDNDLESFHLQSQQHNMSISNTNESISHPTKKKVLF